jgi:NADPH-dependent 2,4-dienoyl-CoA reductase/sulfur reductase-like enzyme
LGPWIVTRGAALAGLRRAEAVLAALPGAQVALLGDEPQPAYTRPPLPKEAHAALAAGAAGAAA